MGDHEESVYVEVLEEDELAVVELIQSFGESLQTASLFIGNGYTVQTLRIVQRQEIEELLPPPRLSVRSLLEDLSAWRIGQGEADCRNRRSGIGQQVQRNGLLYEGSWKDGLRHGHGIVCRKAEPGGTYAKIYVGAWEGGRKEGFGVKYYKRGKYVGFWRRDQRSGRGFMWFDDGGNLYMGHWADDRFHGLGVLMEGRTGNLYQGEFRGGKKHGEGMYVHSRTGQIQRGFWTEGVFRTGTLEDWNRNQVLWPTVYPIPEIKVANFPEVFDGWMDQYSKALKI